MVYILSKTCYSYSLVTSYNLVSRVLKCWVYILEEEINFIAEDFNKIFIEICEKWTSHDTSVVSSFKIFKNRYIVLFA